MPGPGGFVSHQILWGALSAQVVYTSFKIHIGACACLCIRVCASVCLSVLELASMTQETSRKRVQED